MEDNKVKYLKWRFDANTFRLLGRELITDRITAVFELVKNSYDANATKVMVQFVDVSSENANRRKVFISDNGIGMTLDDIENKWMVVGTNSKRKELYSAEPFKRRFVGEKGIGRFAVDKLGSKVVIKTKQKNSTEWLNIVIDWNDYEKKSISNEDFVSFADIENKCFFTEADKPEESGTTLELTGIRDIWSKLDIERLYKELTKLISPFNYYGSRSFQVYVDSNEYREYNTLLVKADTTKYASYEVSITFNSENHTQQTLKFDKTEGKVYKVDTNYKIFGPVNIQIFYFDKEAKKKYNAIYKNNDTRIDGVKIYRDGVITTPFAEFESHRDNKRDILGIDKRLWSDAFNKVGSREVIGIVEISKELNPSIIDATNRQDFIDNPAYRELKRFIIEQLEVFSELKIFNRKNVEQKAYIELDQAVKTISEFTEEITKIEESHPEIKEALKDLKNRSKKIRQSIKKGIEQQKISTKEFIRKENIYLSLMSLQEYASHLSHAVRTSLGKIKRKAEFFKNRFPDEKYNGYFKQYATEIFEEMNTLEKVINSMLSYAGSNIEIEPISIKFLVEELLYNSFKVVFESENIRAIVEIQNDIILNANKQFIQDIFQNLISNSIKSLKDVGNKIIKCSGHAKENFFNLYFSDNGIGINEGDEDKIFDIYYTTTAEQGGAGLGLYIVKTRVEALKGKISVVESEFSKGATFQIAFPFSSK